MGKYTVFTGAATACVTPFGSDGKIDFDTMGMLIDRQIDAGIDALVICGTTGESATLDDGEKAELYRFAVGHTAHRVPVIAGTGTNRTSHAISLSREALAAGADALLVVTPYYNKASAAGLLEHYAAIAGAVSLPVIVYTVPSRTGMGLHPSVLGGLFAIPNIVGIKDATGDISHTAHLIAAYGNETAVYSGNDDMTLPVLSLGGCGVISVLSNLLPARMHELCRLYFGGKTYEAAELAAELLPLCDAMFCEVNPIPVKTAMAELGLCRAEFRLPLCPASPEVYARVCRAISAARLTRDTV